MIRLDYNFNDKIDVKLIALFIIKNFRMPVPEAYVVDTVMLQPIVNYFDLSDRLGELFEEGFITYYTEDNERFYSLTEKGTEALEFFSQRIPKTVRERLLRTIKIKIKELKNALSVKAEYEKVSDIEYSISLSIFEGLYQLLGVCVSVSDEKLAKKICADFKKNPQAIYSDIISTLIKE